MSTADVPLEDPSLATPTLLLALGGIGLYIAARLVTALLVGRGGLATARAGTVAIGQWLPIVAVAVSALLIGRPDVALAVTFASAVAAVALAGGMVAFLAPNEPTPPTRRAWPFLLPAGLLAVLIGFGGAINIVHAGMLVLIGFFVLSLWLAADRDDAAVDAVLRDAERSDAPTPVSERNRVDTDPETTIPNALTALPQEFGSSRSISQTPASDDANPGDEATASTPVTAAVAVQPNWLRWLEILFVLGIAIVAARAAVHGVAILDAESRMFRATILAAGVLSPFLTLPLLAISTEMAQRGRTGEATSACVGVALLNLLVLVPLLVLVWWILLATKGLAWPSTAFEWPEKGGIVTAVGQFVRSLPSLRIPHLTWRLDMVVLTVLGVALLPAAIGRSRLGRLEGVALLTAYAAYLAATAFMTSRP